ncbi:MAG: DUF815 domain-containing protein [bacterium]|nr:DUF815 domain-containing protein [bacterium]
MKHNQALPAAARALTLLSSYWSLLSTAEENALRLWLSSGDEDVRLEAEFGPLLFAFDIDSIRLRDVIPQRILQSDTHPYFRQIRNRGADKVDPVVRQQMRGDLQRWQLIRDCLPDIGAGAGSATFPADIDPWSTCDPFHAASPPWSPAAARKQLLTEFQQSSDWGTLVDALGRFVRTHGIGENQGCVAFRFEGDSTGANLRPIPDFAAFDLSWLAGNERRIARLQENTQNLLAGYRAHNTLIWGPRGCGKSSLIRGLITRHWLEGLRGIEVPYRSYRHLPQLFDLVRNRQERFIAVLDNIALERTDPATRVLSMVLDGGLESVPQNLVFYATSNFKDLVDREGERPQGPPAMQADGAPGELRHTDSQSAVRRGFDPQGFQRLDERRALDDRFALKVFIDLPTKSEYDRIVMAYAQRAGLEIPESDLLEHFQIWRMRNNHDLVGGRTARDFILACYPGHVHRGQRSEPDAG